MKPLSERNPIVVGVVGVALTAIAVLISFEYRNLPFVNQTSRYCAYFIETGGLASGADVTVSGLKVGKVSRLSLEGPKVRVEFKVDSGVQLGDRAEAAIKTKSLLGAKILQVQPRGTGALTAPIPVERTTPPYQLSEALGDLTKTVQGLDTGQLSRSLATLSQTFADTPPDLRIAMQGLARFSQSLDTRDGQLRNLLGNANKVTKTLADRTDQVVGLVTDADSLLAQLRTENTALANVFGNLSRLGRELSGFVAENRQTLHPALDKLNGVLTILANRKERLQDAIKRLNRFAMSLGESVSSGPFFNAYLANLLPGQFMQPFVDAAFSDLGLDPNTLPPSELVDPQTGQRATPPLPMPFPRTGQGGPPRTTLPDAITGNPGDPRYPYRQPPPAPAPGGPPPGPPAVTPREPGVPRQPPPSPIYVPAPNEVPPPGGAHR